MTDAADELGVDGSPRSEGLVGKDSFSPDVTGGETVGDWMTPRVISVSPDEPIDGVCKLMADEGIHRVMVVHRSEIKGVISSLDIVRFLARGAKN